MAILRNDTLGTLSQGLTRSRHFVNDMLVQVVLLGMIAVLTFGGWSYQWWSGLDTIQHGYWLLWAKANLAVWLGFTGIDIRYFDQNVWHSAEAGVIVQWTKLDAYAAQLHNVFLSLWTLPVAIGSASWLALAWYLYQLGGNQVDHDVIEGVQLVSPAVYKKTLGKQASDIQLGNVPWVKNAEVQHLLLSGDTGGGKSQLLSQLLEQIRQRGDIAIIYDPKLDFVRDFYDADKDVLLSPFDKRSHQWDVWSDIKTKIDAATFSHALIKENGDDPFWSNASRRLLQSALSTGKRDGLTFKATLDRLMTSDVEALKVWLAGTESSADFSNEKTAASILSEFKNHGASLQYLPIVMESGLSLKQWLDERLSLKDGGWLFLPVPASVKSIGEPIAAAQIELLANHILSQSTNAHRRIWFIVDELPSLPKLPALEGLLSMGRGYGVAAVLVLQNFSQLKKVYGTEGAHAMAGLCSSLISLRVSDTQTAQYVSLRFGKQLRREMYQNQSSSRGKTNSISQGQSESINERAAVSETKISKLPDLEAVFAAKGIANPVAVKVTYKQRPERNVPWDPVPLTNLGDDLVIAQDQVNESTPKAWDI